ncbi:MAG TPA: dTMP kinase [Acidimicrobiales bacterium]|nr:dTMP kinase [Acidimicrobiales bacterium]
MTARFIAFEGGEACGKSTQAARLAARLGAVLTREPGGTPLGARLRAVLLDPETRLVDRAEALLMAADRAQHVAEVIRPELDAGRHVVTDRYAGSSLAYQGFGRGLPLDEVRHLSAWASGDLWPDLTVLLDVPLELAAERQSGGRPDRLESAGDDFHRRVTDGFRALAAGDRDRWVVIDGTLGIDEVEQMIWSKVTERYPDLAEVAPAPAVSPSSPSSVEGR